MAQLTNLQVSFLSLVKRPATGKPLMLKSAEEGQRAQTFEIAKMDGERMVAYGVVYAPGEVDAHGDTADAKTIERAAYHFMRDARLANIDVEHSFSPEQAYVAESWIVRKGDAYFGNEPEGAWAVGIQIADPFIWDQLKKGDLTGISLAGVAQVDPSETDVEPAPIEVAEKDEGMILRFLKQFITGKEANVDKEEVREIVRGEIGDAVTDALKTAGVIKPEPTIAEQVDAAVGAALAKAGVSAGSPPDEDAALDGRIADAVAKAIAKGAPEAGPPLQEIEEAFV